MSDDSVSRTSHRGQGEAERKKKDSNLVSRIIATEARPQGSDVERSRGSPQNLDVELRSKKYSHPGYQTSGSKSAPIHGPSSPRPYTFTPPSQYDSRASRYLMSNQNSFPYSMYYLEQVAWFLTFIKFKVLEQLSNRTRACIIGNREPLSLRQIVLLWQPFQIVACTWNGTCRLHWVWIKAAFYSWVTLIPVELLSLTISY